MDLDDRLSRMQNFTETAASNAHASRDAGGAVHAWYGSGTRGSMGSDDGGSGGGGSGNGSSRGGDISSSNFGGFAQPPSGGYGNGGQWSTGAQGS